MKMKKIFLLLLLPALAFISCSDDDDYSLDKYWIGLATVENPDNEPYFYLRMDNNELMWVAANAYFNYRPRTGQRILADYTILNDQPESSGYDHDIRLNDAYNILTKGIVTINTSQQDSIGNNSIDVRDIWVGGDFLNIEFHYLGNNQRHMLNLVNDTAKIYTDGKTHLEFRHNAFNDAQNYAVRGLVSFDLRSLRNVPLVNNGIELVIHALERDGQTHTYELTYRFDGNNSETKEYDREYFSSGRDLNIE